MRVAPGTSLPQELLRRSLPAFLARQRWFGGKARSIGSVETLDIIPMADERVSAELVLALVHYADHEPDEAYCIPLLSARDADSSGFGEHRAAPPAAEGEWALRDAVLEPRFLSLLLKAIERGLVFRGSHGEVRATSTSEFRRIGGPFARELIPTLLKGEQSNSSVVFEDRFVLKLLRQAREGINPELEIGTFLTEPARGARVPSVAGSIVYYGRDAMPRTLGILQSFVPNQGNAWEYTLRALAEYSVRVATAAEPEAVLARPDSASTPLAGVEVSPELQSLVGSYLSAAELLGRRTAELHHALASDSSDPRFAPEPVSASYQVALLRSMMEQWARVFELLRGQLSNLSETVRPRAEELLQLRRAVEEHLQSIVKLSSDGARLRIHGDYHLGQVLCSDGDFTIIDFEGEPARSLAERRTKHSPLQDVAGMLRSFHYAAHQGARHWLEQQGARPERVSDSKEWIRFWRYRVSSRFMSAYLETSRNVSFLPSSTHATAALLNICLLNKAIYELEYELNNRPDWVMIPLEGILEILGR
jgi:trehalose synthase-fused probable maltokinase